MKKYISFLILTFFISTFSFAQNDLEKTREAFRLASKTEEQAEKFNNLMKAEDLDLEENLHKVYLGASEATLAKFHALGEGKIKSAKAGKKHIEEAVKADKENLEIRLVRLIIQENTPKIAGYKENIEEDKEFIIKHFKSTSTDIQHYIKKVIEETEIFNEKEINQLD